MANFRYKKSLILLSIYYAFFVIVFIITLIMSPSGDYPDFTPFVLGHGITDLLLIIFVFWPIFSIIGGYLLGYILTPLFLFIHKKILGKKLVYGIQNRPKPAKFKKTFQAFIPAIMAVNFALIIALNEDLVAIILSDEVITGASNEAELFMVSMLVSPLFTIGISMALFSPIWFLLDAGITYSNQKKVEGTDKLVETKTVGGWFLSFLKGYAGIGVIITYYQIIFQVFGPHFGFAWYVIVNDLIFIFFMFLLTFSAIPAIIILDISRNSRVKYVRKWANKLGITENVEVILRNVDSSEVNRVKI